MVLGSLFENSKYYSKVCREGMMGNIESDGGLREGYAMERASE
jgi:hypothetical protein